MAAPPPEWLDASTALKDGLDWRLEVVVPVDELLAEELDGDALAAPPPRAMDVAPLAELSVKSAETVCEIVPLVTLAVM